MARKPDIEYINKYYVHGSEAKIIAFRTTEKKAETTLPKPLQEKKMCIVVDPVALCGLLVAMFMLVVMAVGLGDYKNACMEHQAMEDYLIQLQDENLLLKHNYRNSYDIHKVKETALALGMVPASEVAVSKIEVKIPEPKEEFTWWGNLKWSLGLLFADA